MRTHREGLRSVLVAQTTVFLGIAQNSKPQPCPILCHQEQTASNLQVMSQLPPSLDSTWKMCSSSFTN